MKDRGKFVLKLDGKHLIAFRFAVSVGLNEIMKSEARTRPPSSVRTLKRLLRDFEDSLRDYDGVEKIKRQIMKRSRNYLVFDDGDSDASGE